MLILTRRAGESLFIAKPGESPKEGDVKISVLGFRGNQVRIGIEAPDDVKVLREELMERNQDEL